MAIGGVQLEPSAFEHRNDSVRRQCQAWELTPGQAQKFFMLSTRYPESPYSEFYQLPCAIEGRLTENGKAWNFRINAGATGVWTSGSERRFFGCTAPACEELVLLMPDGMTPD